VKSLGASAGIEQRLAEILASTREDGSEGAGALLDLSRAYLEGGRPDVARALCLSGLRGHRDDARFPQCLARICATENDYGGALAWYADAIALVPEERALYDEILEVLKGLIEEGPLTTDVANTHLLATRATEILRERMRRWPKSPPPVAPEELYNAIGEAQMNAGDTAAAERSFGESLAARQTVPTSLQLGLLLERKGRAQQAVAIYTKALETVSGQAPDAARQRAELLERLGDAQRNSGHRPESVHAYEQALAAWAQIVPGLHGRVAGVAELRRGVVLGRLGRNDDAKAAFERAIDAAPGMRETYATILAFLVVHSPDSAFAHEVFHRAQNQVGLATEWKVYFALWLRMIAGRSGQSGDADASEVFESFESGHDWPAKLSGFGSGKLSYDALLAQTSGPGEQAEAHFYEGARRLALGDYAGAQAMFSQVLDTGMVAFYEFAMAQELLAQPAPEPVPAVVAKPTK
jgi:tetratricopeptide (TPR) repeat protein